MKHLQAFLLLLCFAATGSLHGQVVDYSQADTSELHSALSESFYLLDSDIELFNEHITEIMARATELNDAYTIRYATAYHGLYFYYIDNFDSAVSMLSRAKLLMEQEEDANGLGNIYNYIGIVYDEALMHDEALDAYQASLKYQEELKDTIGIANLLNNIAVIREKQGLIDEAENLYNRALIYYLQSDHSPGVATIYNNLGMIAALDDDLEGALNYYLKSLKIEESISSKSLDLALSYNNLGSIYSDMDNHELAIYYYQKALNLYNELHNRSGVSMVLANMAYSQAKLGEVNTALVNSLEALDISLEIQSIDDELFAREVLTNVYEMSGEFEKAYFAQSKFKTLSDSLQKVQVLEIKRYMNQQSSLKRIEVEAQKKLEQPQIPSTNLLTIWLVFIGISLAGLFVTRNQNSSYQTFILALLALSIGGLCTVLLYSAFEEQLRSREAQVLLSLISLVVGLVIYRIFYDRIAKK